MGGKRTTKSSPKQMLTHKSNFSDRCAAHFYFKNQDLFFGNI
ncbi:hypothetical protein HJ01_02763 [Flavobacterium frigoris PS1]|uniref:Uncharacterized protein n=1 Tax=Flavobacterium frigoris (strain PS1) TaxID=1086011 RepID=H7FU43_FLAFP|nr:hypothetical protein HJ01_02763 [Flavobacterium frigoris PS1]